MSGPGISFAEAGAAVPQVTVTNEALQLAMQLLRNGGMATSPGAVVASPTAAPASWGAQAASWAAPAAVATPGGLPQPVGVLIPLTVALPNGSEATVYLQFGPEVATPQALQAVIAQAVQAGVPIKVWQPRRDSGGGGWNGGGGRYNGGGYGGRRY